MDASRAPASEASAGHVGWLTGRFVDTPAPRGDTDIGPIVDRTAEDRQPYTVERLRYDGGSVAHFAVTVRAEVAAIAANVAPHWPLIVTCLARVVVCNTPGHAPDLEAARDVPDCQMCIRFIERVEDQIDRVIRQTSTG